MSRKLSKIEDLSPTIYYTGNGATIRFPYQRMFWKDSEIQVYLENKLQSGGYSLETTNKSRGTTVVFATPPAEGVLVTITRVTKIERNSEFEESGVFRADVTNDELNHILACIQQVNDKTGRSLTIPITDTGIDPQLPAPNPGKALLWNAAGNKLENSKDDFNTLLTNTKAQADIAREKAAAASSSAQAAAQSATAAAGSASQAAATAAAFDAHAAEQTSAFDTNASQKTDNYNQNAVNQTAAFDANASEKTNTFNSNAAAQIEAFNLNAVNKTNAFDSHVTEKQNAFDAHTADKTTAFDNNAAAKTEIFNNNAAEKQTSVGASAAAAAGSASAALASENNAKASEVVCQGILERLGTVIKIKGRVDNIENLPTSGNLDGDAYLVGSSGLEEYPEYYWFDDHWEFLGTTGTKLAWGNITGEITAQSDLQNVLTGQAAALSSHAEDKSNPHAVTKAQVGLGNCDNTSDVNKPVSAATQNALNLKANLDSPAFTGAPTVPTPAVSDSSTKPVNSQWFNQKMVVVETLPSNPDANIFYFCTNG